MNLKELSSLLNLSQTTVSRALNGFPEVSEVTRRRVQDAARRFNYKPNSRALGLATGRARAIGHVISTTVHHELVNPIFGDFVAGAAAAYGRRGYDMIFKVVDKDDEEHAYRELIARRAVDGVVLQGPAVDEPRIQMLISLKMPFVVHGRASNVTQPYDWIDVNNRSAFRSATEYLLALGHRRIALINGLETMDFAFRRRQGYLDALSASGLVPDPLLMKSAEMTENYGHRETRELLNMPNPPTAIVVASMMSAIGVRRALLETGKIMGKDVSVVTYDDDISYLRNGQDRPVFTAMRSSVRGAGEVVADMLITRIDNPHAAAFSTLLETEFVIGTSTGPAPGFSG